MYCDTMFLELDNNTEKAFVLSIRASEKVLPFRRFLTGGGCGGGPGFNGLTRTVLYTPSWALNQAGRAKKKTS